MNITEVKVNLTSSEDQKLLAFGSVTFDQQFVVRDLRIILNNGQLFVAMPSRKVTLNCPNCQGRNVINSSYCNHCGVEDPANNARYAPRRSQNSNEQPYTDIAHPINQEFRSTLEAFVLEEFDRQRSRTIPEGHHRTLQHSNRSKSDRQP